MAHWNENVNPLFRAFSRFLTRERSPRHKNFPNFPAMINVLRKVWAVYGVLVFGIQLLLWIPIMLITFLVVGRRGERPIIWIGHHIIAPLTLGLTGVRRRVHDRDKVLGKGPFVIVSNHRSFLDILINAAAYPDLYKFLSKKEMTKIPVWGFVVKRLCILVDRKSPESRAESMERMRQSLDAGFSILLYPEGTRNRGETPLTDFFDGAFRLAVETGYPMAIQTLVDPRKYNDPRRSLDLAPGKVDVYWDVIEGTKELGVEALKAKTRAAMLSRISGI
jgi:1-acyl-sn-glycerol-3-phosphate acyltransferase